MPERIQRFHVTRSRNVSYKSISAEWEIHKEVPLAVVIQRNCSSGFMEAPIPFDYLSMLWLSLCW